MGANQINTQQAKLKPANAAFYGACVWIAFVGVCLAVLFLEPELVDPQRIRRLFAGNLEEGLLAYFVISTLRGFTLVPSTPIVLAGMLAFPPVHLWLVNQLAVYTSSAIVYFMARCLRSDEFFRARYPERIERLTALLQRRELPVIGFWGAAPFVPSDLIVYVCSVLRISLWKTLVGISIGEGIICAFYIFGGAASIGAALRFFSD